ncbi:MAG: ETC complex I subunit [OCS116 cluster bacterium]|nr:ETC complex I subunit [OCS116 cluster bacterium]
MLVHIYQPARNPMQSGVGKTKNWLLEFDQSEAKKIGALAGYLGSGDTLSTQLKMSFDNKEDAIAFAVKKGLAYKITEPQKRARSPKAYSDNFAYGRKVNWTH